MAYRPGRRLLHLLIPAALAVTGCSGSVAAPTTVPAAAATTTGVVDTASTTRPDPTTSSTSTSTTSPPEPPTTIVPEIDAEVTIPDGPGPHPAVVLVHGGAWVGGSPSGIGGLARHLAAKGFLTVNARYKLSDETAGFPTALDDIACAVRFAASHPDGDGTVAVVGHSAGAHIGAVVALTGDLYGPGCPTPGTGRPDRFVGLAGPYDVTRLGFLMLPFFGVGPAQAPEAWRAGNPQELVDRNPGLEALIMHGDTDGIVELGYSVDFHRALDQAGVASHMEVIPGARHLDLVDPSVIGDLIVVWLER